jgi:hypothetical protein
VGNTSEWCRLWTVSILPASTPLRGDEPSKAGQPSWGRGGEHEAKPAPRLTPEWRFIAQRPKPHQEHTTSDETARSQPAPSEIQIDCCPPRQVVSSHPPAVSSLSHPRISRGRVNRGAEEGGIRGVNKLRSMGFKPSPGRVRYFVACQRAPRCFKRSTRRE